MAEDFYTRMIANPIARTILAPASFVYGAISYARIKAYSLGWMKRMRPSAPTISIGNLSVGGTGKTPVTIDIADRLCGEGLRVAILSRGYMRKSQEAYTIVSNGEAIQSSCLESGDEPYMMAQAVPAAVVIAGRVRTETAKIALDQYKCDVIVLDDGFQHLALRRDFDVVLLDYTETLDDLVVPAGRLREPLSALGRATHVVISKLPDHYDSERMRRFEQLIEKHAPQAQVSVCRFKPTYFRQKSPIDPKLMQGKSVLAMCGIARPQSFVESIESLGVKVLDLHAFPDHHWFSDADLEGIEEKLQSTGADLIVTTEKDFVRLNLKGRSLEEKVVALVLETEWLSQPPSFKLPPTRKNLEAAHRV